MTPNRSLRAPPFPCAHMAMQSGARSAECSVMLRATSPTSAVCTYISTRDAQLGGKALQEHGHQVGQQDNPQERIAELGTPLDVCGEVPRV